MNTLKSPGLKNKDQSSYPKDIRNDDKQDPHAHNGCCGSCGGQNKNQEKK